MVRSGIIGILALLGAMSMAAESREPVERCNIGCLLDTIWTQAERFNPDRRARLSGYFLETVALTEDIALIETWETRLRQPAMLPEDYENYALKKVSRYIDEQGWDAFFQHAQTRAYPFNSGRPEMMAAAAEHLANEDLARRIYALMETLAAQDKGEMAFERASFGHALVEAAMRRCDLESFDRLLELTDTPDNIRYAFWRTRMAGDVSDLNSRILADFDPENADLLRQSLDGLSTVLKLGNCHTLETVDETAAR